MNYGKRRLLAVGIPAAGVGAALGVTLWTGGTQQEGGNGQTGWPWGGRRVGRTGDAFRPLKRPPTPKPATANEASAAVRRRTHRTTGSGQLERPVRVERGRALRRSQSAAYAPMPPVG